MDTRTLGVLGAGQLGRMLVESAHRLNIKTLLLDAPGAPAKQINALHEHIDGSFKDAAKIKELSQRCDVITTEIEHVDAAPLAELENQGFEVWPSSATIITIQDKYVQHKHLAKHNLPLPYFVPIDTPTTEALEKTGVELGYPYMLKSRTMAYDGRGNYAVKTSADIAAALEALGDKPLYAEKWCEFTRELAVMVVRGKDGQVASYPAVETVQENSICKYVYAPARNLSSELQSAAQKLAREAIASLPTGAVGIFGVEMFELPGGKLLLNEIAPRPHNSGHYTLSACEISQFEAHIRAVMGLPLPETIGEMKVQHCVMYNLLGEETIDVAKNSLNVEGASVYLYGKAEMKKGRKMGHINIVGSTPAEVDERLARVLGKEQPKRTPVVGIIMGSDSDLPTMRPAAEFLTNFDIPFELTIVSAHRTPERMFTYAQSASARGLQVIIAGAGGAAHLPGMVAALTPLPVIGVPVRGSVLDGVDSLHSIVQMPRGVPVATVAIGNSTNAGLLAVRMVGMGDSRVREKMEEFMRAQREEVEGKIEVLEEVGWKEYGLKK
ncbi:phosphoribosylaminoimidazole carboxylase ade2 [Saitoella coloradoensis]